MFHIVREGSGFVEVEGFEPNELREGDLIIVLDDLNHSVVDQPGRPTIQSADLVTDHSLSAAPPAVNFGDGERKLRLICGMLQFENRGFNPAFAALPPFILIRRDDGPPNDWLQANLFHIIREAESGRPGSDQLLSRLTELLFVETLRCYLKTLPAEQIGWFAALEDPIVGRALHLIHADPGHRWTVAELARRAGASRSSFSARFAELLEMAPMAYTTRWRIRVAMKLLADPRLSLSEVASTVGYESESAFHRAFKRECGVPPATYRSREYALGLG